MIYVKKQVSTTHRVLFFKHIVVLFMVLLWWTMVSYAARTTSTYGRRNITTPVPNSTSTISPNTTTTNPSSSSFRGGGGGPNSVKKSPLHTMTTANNNNNNNDQQQQQYESTNQDANVNMQRSDQYIYDLMGSLMTTIHEKLKRSETLENTCRSMLDQMTRRLDTMEQKFDYHNNRIDVAVSKLRSIDSKLMPQIGGGTLDVKLQAIGSKVDNLGTKLSELKNDVVRDKRGTAVVHGGVSDIVGGDLSAQSSERRDIVRDKSGRMVVIPMANVDAEERVTKDIESVKDTLDSLDKKIQGWMQHVSNTANNIAVNIGDLHDAIIEPGSVSSSNNNNFTLSDLDISASSSRETVTKGLNNNTTTSGSASDSFGLTGTPNKVPLNTLKVSPLTPTASKETKLDKLFRKINPVLRVTEKMDEMWDVVLGTQRLVDDSLQKSDQLLTNSYRQVQSLADVKTYLQRQTGKIMQNLEQVEEWLKEQGGASSASNIDPKVLTQGIKDILNKTMQFNTNKEPENSPVSGRAKPQALERSSEPQLYPGDDAYHRDSEYAHDKRKTQTLEPKTTSSSSSSSGVAPGGGVVSVMNVTTTSRMSFIPMFKRKQLGTPIPNIGTNKTGYGPTDQCPFQGPPGINCADLRTRGVTKSGVYYILIKGTTYWFMKVYCDMETNGGGWTVMHNRDNYGHPRENFIRDWNDYKNGFGDMNRDFWLGNENVFMLTNQEDYVLRVDLEDFDSHKRYAIYTKFKIFSEAENYKLEIGNYEGNAGDSLNDPWYGSNLNPFSTYDRDNDRSSLNCASMLRGGWWWRSCGRGLNGIYLTNPTDLAARQGIVWFRWKGWDYTLKRARMSIRPKAFVPPVTTTTTTTKG